jgi:hypothetical protein
MKPLQELLAALKQQMTDLREKANLSLSKVGPLEQQEVGREILWALNDLKYSTDVVEKMIESVAAIETKLPGIAEEVVSAALADKITAGELVKKVDVDTQLIAAELKGKNEAETAAAQAAASLKLVTDRRAELTKEHGAEAVDAITTELLGAENFDEVIKPEFTRRASVLAEIGIKPAEKTQAFVALALSPSFDEAGIADFDARVESIKSVTGGKAPSGTITASKKLVNGQPPVLTPDQPAGASKFSGAF